MADHGWIKLFRQLSDNEIWLSEKFTDGQAWVDLLLLANHKKGFIKVRGIRIDIQPGQCGYSILTLAKRWKWSRGKVIRFIDFLEKNSMIETIQQKNKVSTIISIVNYSIFQSSSTTNGTTDGQQTDTNKNDKKEKNNISVIFEDFRIQYPGVKRALDVELKDFLKTNKPETVNLLLPALQAEISHRENLSKQNEFIPKWKNLKTWLNQKCWTQVFPEIAIKPVVNNQQQKPEIKLNINPTWQ